MPEIKPNLDTSFNINKFVYWLKCRGVYNHGCNYCPCEPAEQGEEQAQAVQHQQEQLHSPRLGRALQP